jgi:hypothetical protein
MQDKRRLQRFDLKVPARVEGLGNGRVILDLITNDICAGGAFFHTDKPLPEGTKVRIDLMLPLGGLKKLLSEFDHAHIRVTGTVLRINAGGMAICFDRDYSIRPLKGRELI